MYSFSVDNTRNEARQRTESEELKRGTHYEWKVCSLLGIVHVTQFPPKRRRELQGTLRDIGADAFIDVVSLEHVYNGRTRLTINSQEDLNNFVSLYDVDPNIDAVRPVQIKCYTTRDVMPSDLETTDALVNTLGKGLLITNDDVSSSVKSAYYVLYMRSEIVDALYANKVVPPVIVLTPPLRVSQEEVIAYTMGLIAEHDTIKIQAPTGIGKTRIAQEIIERVQSKTILYITCRRNAKEQAHRMLSPVLANVNITFITYSISDRYVGKTYDLIIVDEAHHVERQQDWQDNVNRINGKKLHLSATYRLKPDFIISRSTALKRKEICHQTFIFDKYDSTISKQSLYDKLAAHHRLFGKILVYMNRSIEAQDYSDYFNSMNGQYRSAAITQYTKTDLHDMLNSYEGSKDINIIFSVEIIGESTDLPSTTTIVLVDPRKSVVDTFQKIGRGNRVYPGKYMGYVITCYTRDEVIAPMLGRLANEYDGFMDELDLAKNGDSMMIKSFGLSATDALTSTFKFSDTLLDRFVKNSTGDAVEFDTVLYTDLVIRYYDETGHPPLYHDVYDGYPIGTWFNDMMFDNDSGKKASHIRREFRANLDSHTGYHSLMSNNFSKDLFKELLCCTLIHYYITTEKTRFTRSVFNKPFLRQAFIHAGCLKSITPHATASNQFPNAGKPPTKYYQSDGTGNDKKKEYIWEIAEHKSQKEYEFDPEVLMFIHKKTYDTKYPQWMYKLLTFS